MRCAWWRRWSPISRWPWTSRAAMRAQAAVHEHRTHDASCFQFHFKLCGKLLNAVQYFCRVKGENGNPDVTGAAAFKMKLGAAQKAIDEKCAKPWHSKDLIIFRYLADAADAKAVDEAVEHIRDQASNDLETLKSLPPKCAASSRPTKSRKTDSSALKAMDMFKL
eukprot:10199151-Lingulodinium_polyedra.AAC.1